MNSTALLSLVFAAIAAPAFAAPQPSYTTSRDGRKVIVEGAPAAGVAMRIEESAATTIYSNLATKYKKGIYFSGEGATLCGPGCTIPGESWIAAGFTPTADATAMSIRAGVGIISGPDSITLAIYTDKGGIPGKELWSGVAKNLPAFGTCCALAHVNISGGLALKGGTPYWLVAETDQKEADTFGAWSPAEVDQVDPAPVSYNLSGNGWRSDTETTPPSFGIFSK